MGIHMASQSLWRKFRLISSNPLQNKILTELGRGHCVDCRRVKEDVEMGVCSKT